MFTFKGSKEGEKWIDLRKQIKWSS